MYNTDVSEEGVVDEDSSPTMIEIHDTVIVTDCIKVSCDVDIEILNMIMSIMRWVMRMMIMILIQLFMATTSLFNSYKHNQQSWIIITTRPRAARFCPLLVKN